MRIAITGGIAEGKSTVRKMLAQRGFTTASADEVAAEVFRDAEVNARLAELLGVEGPITGGELREALMRTPEIRRTVNGIMHPPIVRRMREMRSCFDEIPLLFENCRQGDYDAVLLVSCSAEEKRERLLQRYGEEPEDGFGAISRWQFDNRFRRIFTDWEITTDGSFESVERSVDELVIEMSRVHGVSRL